MGDKLQSIDFYQLAGDQIDELAAQLADKCHATGKKLVIYAAKEQCQSISRALWVLRDLSFLAHGIDGDDGAEFADIWICSNTDDNPISADFAMTMSSVTLPDMTVFERIFVLFNGKDQDMLQLARDQWKSYSQSYQGRCRYFAKTDEGRWEQKATA